MKRRLLVLTTKIIGFIVSYLTPSMYFGGEPVKAYLISKKHGLSLTKLEGEIFLIFSSAFWSE